MARAVYTLVFTHLETTQDTQKNMNKLLSLELCKISTDVKSNNLQEWNDELRFY